MQKFFQGKLNLSQRYGLALLPAQAPARELPLRPCQRQALEESQASAGLYAALLPSPGATLIALPSPAQELAQQELEQGPECVWVGEEAL
jgi:hypothetical protein